MHRSTFLSLPAGRLARAALAAAGLALAAAVAAPAAASAAPTPTLSWASGGTLITSADFSQSQNAGGSSVVFRVVNTSQSASSALTITVTGSAAFSKGPDDTCTGTSLSRGASCIVRINFFPPLPTTVGQTFSATATARPASQDRATATLTLAATIEPNCC